MASSAVNGDARTDQPTPDKAIIPNPASDPAIYDVHHEKFASEGLPPTSEAWLSRARQVSEILAQDAAARDIENKSPRAEIALLKSAGLLRVLGPAEIGGGGQTWEIGYKVIREVAKGDGSIGMLC
jgi:alkylation response protein AidB-like acyl-CoA dehydrogenase